MNTLYVQFKSSYQGASDYTVHERGHEPRRFTVRTDLPDFLVERVRADERYTVEEREKIAAHYLALVGTVVAHDGRRQFPSAEVVQAIAVEMAKGGYAEPLVLVGARHTGGYGVEYDGAAPETPIRAGSGLTMPVLGRWWLALYGDRKVVGGAL